MTPETTRKSIDILLRTGVALAFIYPPISALLNPYAWVGYFPAFVVSISPIESLLLLHLFGLLELAIGLWILLGKNIFIPAAAAAGMLFLIVAFNIQQIDVLFRDIPIILMAVALCLRYGPSEEKK